MAFINSFQCPSGLPWHLQQSSLGLPEVDPVQRIQGQVNYQAVQERPRGEVRQRREPSQWKVCSASYHQNWLHSSHSPVQNKIRAPCSEVIKNFKMATAEYKHVCVTVQVTHTCYRPWVCVWQKFTLRETLGYRAQVWESSHLRSEGPGYSSPPSITDKLTAASGPVSFRQRGAVTGNWNFSRGTLK